MHKPAVGSAGSNAEPDHPDKRQLCASAEFFRSLKPAEVRSLAGNAFDIQTVGAVFLFYLMFADVKPV